MSMYGRPVRKHTNRKETENERQTRGGEGEHLQGKLRHEGKNEEEEENM